MNRTDTIDQQINDATSFMEGDKFETEQEVREYFTITTFFDMYDPIVPFDQDQLNKWAEIVIANKYHCNF